MLENFFTMVLFTQKYDRRKLEEILKPENVCFNTAAFHLKQTTMVI